MITGAQIKVARELLGWRQAELAKQARIPAHSVESAESSVGESLVPGEDMQAMRAALETAGVEFTNGDQLGGKLVAARVKRVMER
jgi:transcriptional regulator with XRE-family HTH domain